MNRNERREKRQRKKEGHGRKEHYKAGPIEIQYKYDVFEKEDEEKDLPFPFHPSFPLFPFRFPASIYSPALS